MSMILRTIVGTDREKRPIRQSGLLALWTKIRLCQLISNSHAYKTEPETYRENWYWYSEKYLKLERCCKSSLSAYKGIDIRRFAVSALGKWTEMTCGIFRIPVLFFRTAQFSILSFAEVKNVERLFCSIRISIKCYLINHPPIFQHYDGWQGIKNCYFLIDYSFNQTCNNTQCLRMYLRIHLNQQATNKNILFYVT